MRPNTSNNDFLEEKKTKSIMLNAYIKSLDNGYCPFNNFDPLYFETFSDESLSLMYRKN